MVVLTVLVKDVTSVKTELGCSRIRMFLFCKSLKNFKKINFVWTDCLFGF